MSEQFNKQATRAELRNHTETAAMLTEKQFDHSMSYVNIINREIKAEGHFKERLEGLSREFSLGEKFGSQTAERILRDQYALRFGESPNDHLQRLKAREEKLGPNENQIAYDHSQKVPDYLEQQSDPSLYQTFDKMGCDLAKKLNITERKAKSFMVQAYKERHDNDYFVDYGKTEEKRIRAQKSLPEERPKKEYKMKQTNTPAQAAPAM